MGLIPWLVNDVVKLSEEWQILAVFIASYVAIIIISYLLGSINSAIIVSKTLFKDDIRNHGSGNAGLTNVLRTYGKKAAGLTLFGDMLKSVLAICTAGILFGFGYVAGISVSEPCYIAGLFAVVGHIFPVYYEFRGGKGVLSTATVVLVLAPIPFLVLFSLFAIIVCMSKYVSLGSVCAALLFPVIVNGYFLVCFKVPPFALISLSTVLIAILVIWCHRENLKRISDRTERKLSFKKKDVEVQQKPESKDDE